MLIHTLRTEGKVGKAKVGTKAMLSPKDPQQQDGSGFYLAWPDDTTAEIRVPLSVDGSKGMKKSKPLTFTLDRIFPPQTTQEEMFEAVPCVVWGEDEH